MTNDPIDIYLENAIVYTDKDGTRKESNLLVCSKPTVKHKKYTIKLKQIFIQSQQGIALKMAGMLTEEMKKSNIDTTGSKDSEQQITKAKDIIDTLYFSDYDFYDYQERFKKLICGGSNGYSELVKIDGTFPLTSTQYDNLLDEDLEIFIGEYLENFLLNSSMKKRTSN